MSPVCNRNSGCIFRPLILSTAAFSVPTTSVFAGLLKPMWLSLICAKLISPFIAAGSSSPIRLKAYEFRTPPLITQNVPVPAHAMHFRNPRRSIPSWLWSYKISSFFLSVIGSLLSNLRCWPHPLHVLPAKRRKARAYRERGASPRHVCERVHGGRHRRPGFYSPGGTFFSVFF